MINWKNKGKKTFSETVKTRGKSENLTVMFVPNTPDSELVDKLQQTEDQVSQVTGWSTKLIEKPGTPLLTKFIRSFPMLEGCSRGVLCPICENTGLKCMVKRAVYQVDCMSCQQNGSSSLVCDESDSSPACDESNSNPSQDGSQSSPAHDESNSSPACDESNSSPVHYMMGVIQALLMIKVIQTQYVMVVMRVIQSAIGNVFH